MEAVHKEGKLATRCVFGDSFGAFTDSMLGQLSGQKETDGCLDFTRRDGVSLVLVSQTRGFSCDALEDIVHEAVHDGHSLTADTDIGMHLLEDFVDVDAVALFALSSSLGSRG